MPSHEKLERPLVVEVILELQFQKVLSLASYVDRLTQVMRSAYPGRESTNLVGLEFQMGASYSGMDAQIRQMDAANDIPHLPQYKFTGYRGYVFQVGEGVLTIHTTSYQGFDDFMTEIRKITEKHKVEANVASYSSVKLRYLNLIPFGDQGIDPREYLSWGLAFPEQESYNFSPIANTQQIILKYDDDDFQRLTIAVPHRLGNKVGLLIDIDNTVAPQKLSDTEIGSIEAGISQAHQHIWDTFVGLLKPAYFEELKNGNLPAQYNP